MSHRVRNVLFWVIVFVVFSTSMSGLFLGNMFEINKTVRYYGVTDVPVSIANYLEGQYNQDHQAVYTSYINCSNGYVNIGYDFASTSKYPYLTTGNYNRRSDIAAAAAMAFSFSLVIALFIGFILSLSMNIW